MGVDTSARTRQSTATAVEGSVTVSSLSIEGSQFVATTMSVDDIFRAIWEDNLDEVKRIVNADKTAVHARDGFGREALFCACIANYPRSYDIMKCLIEHGADVNCACYEFRLPTALHFAASRGNVQVVKLLLDNEADTSLKNEQGKTADEVAKTNEIRDLIREVAAAKTKTSQDEDDDVKQHLPVDDNLYSKKMKLAKLRHKFSVDMATLDLQAISARNREAETVKELEILKAKLVLEKAQSELLLEKLKMERAAKELEALTKIQVVSEEVQQLEEERCLAKAPLSAPKNPTASDDYADDAMASLESDVTDGNSVESFVELEEKK